MTLRAKLDEGAKVETRKQAQGKPKACTSSQLYLACSSEVSQALMKVSSLLVHDYKYCFL